MDINYFLYARKSTDVEDKQVRSIEDQLAVLRALAKEQGLVISEEFIEKQSAKMPGRPVFGEMLSRIEKGEAQGIVCWKLDRLARNPADGGTIQWMLQSSIIRHIQSYEKSYKTGDNTLLMAVELGMANQFVKDLSVDTKRGMRAKAERGWFPGPAPIGWLHNPIKKQGEKEVLKDDARFEAVRKCWDMMLTGAHTVPQVWEVAVNRWNLTGRMGKKFNLSNMYSMFKNTAYYGEFEYPLRSGIWHHGSYEPMVTIGEFEEVQAILGDTSHPRAKTYDVSMRGPIRCGACGAAITAEVMTKFQKNGNVHKYVYYRCTHRKDRNCPQGRITELDLEKEVMALLAGIEIPQEFYEWAMDVLRESNGKESLSREKINDGQRAEYDRCVKTIDALIDMRARGEITEDEFMGRKASLMTEKNRLQSLMRDADKGVDDWLATAEKYFSFAAGARKKFEKGTSEERRELMTLLGSNLLLKDGKLNVSLAEPLIAIKKMAPGVREINERFQPVKNADNTKALRALYAQNSTRGSWVEDVRTCLIALAG